MEITKQNETFNIADTTESNWDVSGTINNNTDGSLSVYLNITDNSEYIGYYSITVPTEGMINMNITAVPSYSDAVIDYGQIALKTIQDYLSSNK